MKLFGQNVNDEDPDDPTNYASKTLFQRLYILAAGPLMNLLFALIFMPLVFWIGMILQHILKIHPASKMFKMEVTLSNLEFKQTMKLLL